jgi:Tol biopolymer transport system component
MRAIKVLPVFLAVVMILTLTLMTCMPVSAVKGSYPGRNGKIAFDAPHPEFDDVEIYVMNADGTGLQDLSKNAAEDDYSPVWSPDGTKIAFTHPACQQVGACRRIFVMNADGTGQTQLTVETAEPKPFIYHYRPAWSPDGTKIAFFKTGAGVAVGIYVIGADAPGPGVLLIAGRDWPSWSPDGTKIAFMGGAGIQVAYANTGTIIATLATGGSPCLVGLPWTHSRMSRI